MDVKAINSVNFTSRSNKKSYSQKPENIMPQHNTLGSTDYAKSMRNLILGLMALGATTTMTSCDDAEAFASASASASASATAIVVGGGNHCHHDTITVVDRDTIFQNDTIINTIIKPVLVREYPYHLADSLIAQGLNIGVKLDGPVPNGTDDVVFVGSKAHNRYDHKFYETMVDSIGTNERELALVTKVVDMYGDKPKTYHMKTVVNDVPGKGIKLTRYVANTEKAPANDEQYLWNYAGYEIRTNYRDGRQNVRSIFDNKNELVYRGNFERGQEAGTFLYGSLIIDEETGEPFYDEYGEPEFAQYDFDQAVMYSDYAISKGYYDQINNKK